MRCGRKTSPPLYEEAVSRQWGVTRDIPWADLRPLREDLERAQCEFCTFLTEVKMIASGFPAKWLWRMNQHYHEVKMFLCTRAMDEARPLEDYGMTAVREIEAVETPTFDFRLAADTALWCEMIENIRAHGEADLDHTLNRLQLPGVLELTAPDQQRALLFFRYNQTFQQFFNLAARVPTEYSAEPTPAGTA